MAQTFERWFPHSSRLLERIVQDNCSRPLQIYQNTTNFAFLPKQATCKNLYNCISNNHNAITLSTYQASNVLLGLTPTALSLMGNSIAEISLLSSSRPLLSYLLAFAAPTIRPFPSFHYHNPLDTLEVQRDRAPYPHFGRAVQAAISTTQYLVVAAAVANVTLMAYDLSTKSIFVPSCLATFHPYLWTFMAGLIHLGGVCAFATRVRIYRPGHHSWSLRGWLSNETKLCAAHRGVEYELRHESRYSLILSWLVATATVVHLVYGTLVLSSSTFIDTDDAVIIIFRYLLSTVAARIVLMFELYGLQAAVVGPDAAHATGAAEPLQKVVLGNHRLLPIKDLK